MARLALCGAEIDVASGSTVDFDVLGTTSAARDTSVHRLTSGLASAKCSSGAGNATSAVLVSKRLASTSLMPSSTAATYYHRVYLNFGAAPSSTIRVFDVGSTSSLAAAFGVGARLTNAGKLQLFNNAAGTQIGSDSAATLVTDGTTFYRLEMNVVYNASTQITSCELRLNGDTVASTSGVTISASNFIQAGWLAAPGANKDCWVDDYGCNDATGGSQNTWLGDGAVAVLLPISDSAVGTSWTDSGGSGSGLSASVDDTPPNGIADTTSNAGHQIRNAGSASASYDANMTSYTTRGIAAADTVNLVVPIADTGAAAVTGAKTGSLGVVSNPAITNIAFANGASAAANFWAGLAAGTYPNGWKWEAGTLTYAPSVTLGTSPVMRVTITGGTASRIALVDTMAILVDYTPITQSFAPPENFYQQMEYQHLLRR